VSSPPRIFLLSPAHCGGLRARLVLRDGASFPLARRLRDPAGVPLGEVFAFLSELYFRGKLLYANTFARPPAGVAGVQVITPTSGLVAADARVTLDDLRRFGEVDIDEDDPRYRRPLSRSVEALAAAVPSDCEVVMLGSIATAKYVDVLSGLLGPRLLFPPSFVGRGDMSRGGLLLRSARSSQELDYVPLAGAVLHGKRPAKLPRICR
jgi:hypothetical protein